MARDYANDFTGNPGGFIQNHAISLLHIASKLGGPLVRRPNLQKMFTLSRETKWLKMAWEDPIPTLRMMPGLGGDGLTTFLSWYLFAGDGHMATDAIPYCDIPINPGANSPNFLFTVGMNGCSLVIASAVPGTAPPLAAGHWRVLHDHSHYNLARWHTDGYTVRFASYAGANEAGAIPGAFAAAINVNTYNPNNYAWHYVVHGQHGAHMRVVTNFLHWDGNAWNFHSRHFHNYADTVEDLDAPPGTVNPASSTQSIAV
ncbi:hypothetical protein [Sorangium sp. So ce861]|uniref:hypothetical protein n=1 Tax=Sorangium sp. So ce861 TaxID=3133323 RepID=UPI003F63F4B4